MGITLNLYISFVKIAICLIFQSYSPGTWVIFPSSEIFFNVFLQEFQVLIIPASHFLVRVTSKSFELFTALVKEVVPLIFHSP